MKKNTMYILGGVALVGIAYYLYKKKQPIATPNESSNFANIGGTTGCSPNPCPAGFECREYTTAKGTKLKGCIAITSGEK